MATRYVIVGAGVAGTTACQAIRERDPRGEIRVITDEAHPFYTRIRLPQVIARQVPPEKLILKGKDWFQEQDIELHLEEKVLEVRRAPLAVVTATGTYRADRLLLATGGYSFMPPIPGADIKGVFTLRTMDDALLLAEHADKAKTAVAIGGGLLGLEAGNGLRLRGLEVHVVEIFDRLLPRQMDPKGATILQKTMEGMGFRFHLGVRSKEIQGEKGRAKRLLTEDGQSLDADFFLVSAGVRPHLDLAEGLKLAVGRGIVVNDRMETSVPAIYSAGDAVEHAGIYYGIWPAAEAQGRVAGQNMASGAALYKGTVMSNKLKVVGIDLVSAGEIDAEGKMDAEVRSDPSRGVYQKLVYEDDRIVGCVLLGDVRGQKKILQAISEGAPVGVKKGKILDTGNVDL
jgi:nitrite reductase (NADH) large subunit